MTPPASATVLDDLPFHLARMALAFRRFSDRTLRAFGLPAQPPGIASVLHALDERDDCSVNSLVDRTHLPNGTLTGLLDRLERERCLRRTRNAEDGRSWRIRLTPKGRRLCARLGERHRLVTALFADTLSPEETAQLKRLLTRLTARLRAFGADDDAVATVAVPGRPTLRASVARTPAKRRTRPSG